MNLYDLTAAEAIRGIKRREFSPVDLVQAALDRIALTEDNVQAWAFIDAEGALKTARYLEAKSSERRSTDLLYGIPLGVKDNWHVAGMPTTADFEPFRNRVPGEDSAVAARLREAGAVIMGKTVTVQFATGLDSPKTRNPWNPDCTPGGSSSGSAAAIAARQVPLTTGTQTGGSLLRPAAYCGVVGLKPTSGRISRYGLLPVSWSFDEPGVMGRSVADVALMLQVLAQHDARDPYSVRQRAEDFIAAAAAPSHAPRFGLLVDLLERATPEVRAAAENAARELAAQGARVEEVRLPVPMDQLLATHFVHRCTESAAVHGEQYGTLSKHYRPDIAANIEVGQVIPAAVYIQASRLRRRYRIEMTEFIHQFDALIGPTASNVAPSRSINVGDPSFQVFISLFGFPNISLPTFVGDRGLPHAIQIVARPFAEHQLLGMAAWVERIFGPLTLPELK
ncbi:MAG TPA: amidase [Burkholderiaceae bacterium]|nr:amidase [Burkholderiaceae bacterium]